jgi:hypothetical protein
VVTRAFAADHHALAARPTSTLPPRGKRRADDNQR